MKKLDKHLQDKKVEYWITAGSLLGFMRNGGIIPWDDDIDIAVKEEDIPKIQELLESTEDNSLYKFSSPVLITSYSIIFFLKQFNINSHKHLYLSLFLLFSIISSALTILDIFI